MSDLRIETIKLSLLTEDPINARKHDKKNLDTIKASLRQFGQRKPIVITTNNVIVAGNGTAIAARELGWQEIMTVRVPLDWTAEQIKAYALTDNRSSELAEWDSEILAEQLLDLNELGFDIIELGFITNSQIDNFDGLNTVEDQEPFVSPEKFPLPFAFWPDQRSIILKAIEKAKKLTGVEAPEALAYIAELYLKIKIKEIK